jgi:hypothetical protein
MPLVSEEHPPSQPQQQQLQQQQGDGAPRTTSSQQQLQQSPSVPGRPRGILKERHTKLRLHKVRKMEQAMVEAPAAPVPPITITTTKENRKKAAAGPTNSKYTKVQYFGFQIYTGGAPAFLKAGGDEGDGDNDTSTATMRPNPECVGRHSYGEVVTETDPVLQCYLGHIDPVKDVQHRLDIMATAVERAYNESLLWEEEDSGSTATTAGDDDDDVSANKKKKKKEEDRTLKVFVAPEFYWRGVEGAYSVDLLTLDKDAEHGDHPCRYHRNNPICAILRGLQDLVQDVRYQDWFFLFGTIVASQQQQQKQEEALPADDGDDDRRYLYYNFAPLYKGFDPSGLPLDEDGHIIPPPGKRFLLPKRYVSTSDFLTPSRDIDWANKWQEILGPENQPNTTDNPSFFDRKRYDDDLFARYKDALVGHAGYAMIEYDWIVLDGLALSLEICFDHQKKTALNTYLGDIIGGRTTRIPSSSDGAGLEYVPIPPYQAQISLVSSAGMTIVPDSLALTNHGTIFLQDGLSDGPSYQFFDRDLHESCDQGLQFEGGTEAVTRRAVLSNTDVNFLYQVLDPVKRVKVFAVDGNADDDKDDDNNDDHWKVALRDTFSAVSYEPHLVVHAPIKIAAVNTGNTW